MKRIKVAPPRTTVVVPEPLAARVLVLSVRRARPLLLALVHIVYRRTTTSRPGAGRVYSIDVSQRLLNSHLLSSVFVS